MCTWSENGHTLVSKRKCAHMVQNELTHIYALGTHVFTQNFTKIVLIVHFYVMTLSLKFHKDPSFCCRDICKIKLNMQARSINACAHVLTCVCGHFRFVCKCMWTDLYQKVLMAHYSVMGLSFKFCKYSSFHCGDICKIIIILV